MSTTVTVDNEIYDQKVQQLRAKLTGVIPDFEITEKAKLAVEIERLKKEKNAVILGHNYMEPALFHSVADVTGDSLELCRRAAESTADILVFCGVEFMAETAKIINPERKVLIPSNRAGCSLASSITAEDVRMLRKKYPGVPVVAYINTYASVKAEIDVCCTSGNAAKVVESLGSDTVIFIPDEYLAKNVAKQTGVDIIFPDKSPSYPGQAVPVVKEKTFIGWSGKCEVHDKFQVQDIENVRKQFPNVFVLAHPECPPDVVAASDYTGSTSQMIKKVKESDADNYLLLTECAMADNIIAESKDKDILRLCSFRCPHMAQITMEDTLRCLQNLEYEVDVPEDVRVRAKASIDRMLAIP